METPAASKPARFAALRYRNFTYLWSGSIVSNVGTWMQNVATNWMMLQFTNSPLWLGYLALCFAVPMILLPPVAGIVVDRVHRLKLIIFTQSMQMLIAFVLAILTWTHQLNVWHLMGASLLGAIILAFDNPARQALIPDLVERRDLLNALSLNSATYTGAALVGPALAGPLLPALGAGMLFFINGISFLAVLVPLVTIRDVRTHSGGEAAAFLHSLSQGFSYIWKQHLLLALLGMSALAAIFGRSYQSLLSVFGRDIFMVSSWGYGLLLAAAGGGALVGALGLASIRRLERQGAVMVVSGLVFGLSLAGFALSPFFIPALVLLFISGVAATIVGTIIATFIQVAVPNELRGRVMSFYTVTLIGLPSLGALGTGALAERLGGLDGAPHAVLIGAIVVSLAFLLTAPLFWKRDVQHPTV
jgi:MFS family permease